MGLFSFLFGKKKSKSSAQAPVETTAPPPTAPPTAPIGRPDHAPQPIAAEPPIEQNPIAAAVDSQQQFGVPETPEPVTPVMNPVSAPLQEPETPGVPTRSPEEMCEIDPDTMDRDAIRAHLAALYRRHNAAAASLDAELREEAEIMLDAIVACREKYIEAP